MMDKVGARLAPTKQRGLSRGSHDAFLQSLTAYEKEWCEAHLSIGLAIKKASHGD